MKKSYVVVDHVKKILRSLPAKWRPKVTTIERARDLNTLSLEDLIKSLKCLEIRLNEQEFVKKFKSIELKSKGMSSKDLKANESEDESPAGGFEEGPEVEEMDILSKRLQYPSYEKKRFFSRSSAYKRIKFKETRSKGMLDESIN